MLDKLKGCVWMLMLFQRWLLTLNMIAQPLRGLWIM